MRRLVVALIVALLVPMLVGCGGGGGGGEGAAPVAPGAGASTPATATPVTEIPDRSATESATVFEQFPSGDDVPSALAEKLEVGQPTVILFVDGSQKVTDEVRSAVDKALKKNSGVVDLVLFDLGKYASADADGIVVVDADGLEEDTDAALAVSLARKLGVGGLPYIMMTDDQGFLVFRHRGLVDEDYLLMHMERLTD